MHDAPQHEMCVHRERRMNEYVIPTQAPKKEMPAMFGKDKAQSKLLANLEDHFLKAPPEDQSGSASHEQA